MKKRYEELELKVIRFASEDVITASGEEPCGKVLTPCGAIKTFAPRPTPGCLSLECLSLEQPCMDKCAVACQK